MSDNWEVERFKPAPEVAETARAFMNGIIDRAVKFGVPDGPELLSLVFSMMCQQAAYMGATEEMLNFQIKDALKQWREATTH